MREMWSIAKEAAEDIFFGQVVNNWARWFVIVAGAILVITTATDTGELVLGTVPIVALMVVNFYLHGRHAAERPANPGLIAAASLVDLAAVTLFVLFGPGKTGLGSQFFVLYYPLVLAFAFVMPRKATVTYTLATLAIYTVACFLVNPDIFTKVPVLNDSGVIVGMESGLNVRAVKVILMRLVTLAAMGGLGTYYWRVQRHRRRAAMGEIAEVRSRGAGA